MNYITATELRTKASQIIRDLKLGSSMSLIHRSKVIGIIKPVYEPKPFDANAFKKAIKDLNLPKTTYTQREKIYRARLMKKYGKDISGR
ncbi:hypothetical protein HYT32_01510 [Candidatus Roizmanbacteria bacterium]|nr:hypothetical protein [Candidatus Roizmanbacteria bacterium]